MSARNTYIHGLTDRASAYVNRLRSEEYVTNHDAGISFWDMESHDKILERYFLPDGFFVVEEVQAIHPCSCGDCLYVFLCLRDTTDGSILPCSVWTDGLMRNVWDDSQKVHGHISGHDEIVG